MLETEEGGPLCYQRFPHTQYLIWGHYPGRQIKHRKLLPANQTTPAQTEQPSPTRQERDAAQAPKPTLIIAKRPPRMLLEGKELPRYLGCEFFFLHITVWGFCFQLALPPSAVRVRRPRPPSASAVRVRRPRPPSAVRRPPAVRRPRRPTYTNQLAPTHIKQHCMPPTYTNQLAPTRTPANSHQHAPSSIAWSRTLVTKPWRERTLEGSGGSSALLDPRAFGPVDFAWKGRHLWSRGARNRGGGVLYMEGSGGSGARFWTRGVCVERSSLFASRVAEPSRGRALQGSGGSGARFWTRGVCVEGSSLFASRVAEPSRGRALQGSGGSGARFWTRGFCVERPSL